MGFCRLILAYAAGPRRVPERVKSGRPLYGGVGKFKDSTVRLKQTTRRFRSSLDLSASAKGPASRISRAAAIRLRDKDEDRISNDQHELDPDDAENLQ